MPHRHSHAMLGRGGHIVIPRSESAALTEAIQHITNGDYRAALDTLKMLREQVGRGYHRNPNPPIKIVGVMSDDVHSVSYTHALDGEDYEHDFDTGSASLIAILRHGKRDLILTSADGVPLWDEFEQE